MRAHLYRFEDDVFEKPDYFPMWAHSRKWKTLKGYKECAQNGNCEGDPAGLNRLPDFSHAHLHTAVYLKKFAEMYFK